MPRSLIVTADDLGYCRERNRAVTEAFNEGVVTRASLLVNASHAQDAVHLAALHNFPIGLHLNLTEGLPISTGGEIPSLLSPDGFFRGKMGFRTALSEGLLDFSEIRTEVKAQVERFKQLVGHRPPFIDGHQHVHVLEGISAVFAKALEEMEIFCTRLPVELELEECMWIPPHQMDFYLGVVDDARRAGQVFKRHGIRFTHGFVGMATMGQWMSRTRLAKALLSTFNILEYSPLSQDGMGPIKAHSICDIAHVKSSMCMQPGAAPKQCDAKKTTKPQWEISEIGSTYGNDGNDDHKKSGENKEEVSSISSELNYASVLCDTIPKNEERKMMEGEAPASETLMVQLELMVHPGYPCVDDNAGCGNGPDEFARSKDRLHELTTLKDPWFKNFLVSHSIQLSS